MTAALVIFRKDVRHLWPRLLPVWCLAAFIGWEDGRVSGGLLRAAAWTLWILSWLYLVAVAVQQEALPGHRQYWLTRPIGWRDLLTAKLLFVVLCGCLPLLAAESIALAVNGISPLRFAPLLLRLAICVTGAASLIVAAVSAVTDDLVQFLWGFGALSAALVASAMAAEARIGWGPVEWIRGAALLVIVVLAAITVLLQEYRRRTTLASRCILGCGLAVAAFGTPPALWHTAWIFQGSISPTQVAPEQVTLALDPATRPPITPAETPYFPAFHETGINLPVNISVMPADTLVVSERIAARIDAEGGQHWSGAFSIDGGLLSATPGEDAHVVRGDGPYWQYFNIDREFYEAVKDRPVHLHTVVSLTLLGNRRTAPINASGVTRRLPGDGMCQVNPYGPLGYNLLYCEWPGSPPERTYLRATLSRTGRTVKSLLSRHEPPIYWADGSLWDGGSTIFSSPSDRKESEQLDIQMDIWQAVARFDRELDLPDIVLSNYAVRRITDTP